MPKGHKPDCQCPICKRVKAKIEPVAVPKALAKKTRAKVVKPKPVKPEVVKPVQPIEFHMGQQVMWANPPGGIPKDTRTTIEGMSGGQYKIVFKRKYIWVNKEDLKPVA